MRLEASPTNRLYDKIYLPNNNTLIYHITSIIISYMIIDNNMFHI